MPQPEIRTPDEQRPPPDARRLAAAPRSDPAGASRDEEPPWRPLTREEAQALRARLPATSPWFVIAMQALAGCGVALVVWAVSGRAVLAWSALYGAAVVVVPGVLLARGVTSPLSRASPAAGAASFMLWEMVKVGVSLALLALAPRLVPSLSWPVLLLALVVCLKTIYVAALRRRRPARGR